MTHTTFLRVNPATKDEVVPDRHGRPIQYTAKGTAVPRITYYTRLMKEGSLVQVSKKSKPLEDK